MRREREMVDLDRESKGIEFENEVFGEQIL
jgi:hypothetical protein